MGSKRKRSSLDEEVQDSDQVMIQQLQAQHLNQHQSNLPSSNTQQQRFHQQYQEICEDPRNCEEKESSRDIPTSEDIKPELVQHGNNNNNNDDESDFPIAKRILRSSLIVSSVNNDNNQPPTSGGSLWLMNVDGQTNGDRSDSNPQNTTTSDSEAGTASNLQNQNLIQQIGGTSFREHEPGPGGPDGLLGSGGQQHAHHLSDNIQQASHHQNVEDEVAGSVGGRNNNRYLRDYHTLSSTHHHLNNPQPLPPPPPSHHPQEIHSGFEHLGGGGNQDAFEDRYQTRPPVDLSYIRSGGGAGQGPYSPQGAQGVPDPWTAPVSAQLSLEQRYFNAADGLHQSTVSQGNPLGWPTPAEHQGHHHHQQHHRFGGTMGHPSHAAVAAAALAQHASSMKAAWGDSNSSSLNMAVGGAGSNNGRPGSAMSGKSKLCSPTSYSGTMGIGSNPNDFIQDETLAHLTVKELNKRVSNLSRDEVVALKQRRRTLKNRGYATTCRVRRQHHKETLEIQVTGLHDEMKKMRNEIKKLNNERDYYRSQWEKEKYNNNHHGAHAGTSNVNTSLSNGNATSGGNLILGGTGISGGSITTSCSSGIDQPIMNAHHAHSHPHMILPHVSSMASTGNNAGSTGHLLHHPSAGQAEQLVDLRLSSSNGNGGSVEEYKRVAYVAAAVAASANDLKLLR